MTRFAVRYSRFNRALLGLLGLGPGRSGVELEPDALHVWMGWAFDARVPRSSIVAAAPGRRYLLTAGVHGWRGRWLVNGAGIGIVALSIDPPVPARTLFVPIRLRDLEVSVEDPDGLLAALDAVSDPGA